MEVQGQNAHRHRLVFQPVQNLWLDREMEKAEVGLKSALLSARDSLEIARKLRPELNVAR